MSQSLILAESISASMLLETSRHSTTSTWGLAGLSARAALVRVRPRPSTARAISVRQRNMRFSCAWFRRAVGDSARLGMSSLRGQHDGEGAGLVGALGLL